jgi:hypothetical protein
MMSHSIDGPCIRSKNGLERSNTAIGTFFVFNFLSYHFFQRFKLHHFRSFFLHSRSTIIRIVYPLTEILQREKQYVTGSLKSVKLPKTVFA